MATKTLLACCLGALTVLSPLSAGPPRSATENCDTNGDGVRDISDAGFLFGFLFLGRSAPVPFSGEGPFLVENGDCNGDLERDISDGIRLFEFLFLGKEPPVNHRAGSSLPALADTETPAFVVILTADRASGIPGTVFQMTAEVAASNTPIVSYQWSVDGGPLAAGEAANEFVFAEAGESIVEVAVQNAQGEQVVAGTLLSVFPADAAAEPRGSEISPATGFPGTFVQLVSNTLNDPAAHFEVEVGESARVEPFRPELGVGNFLVPLDAADDLNGATSVDVRLYADDALAETFAFTLSPLPDVADPPGVLARRWLEEGGAVLASVESEMVDALSDLAAELETDELAFAQSLLQLASARFEQVREVLLPLFDELAAEHLTLLDQILVANGLDLSLLDLPRGGGATVGDELIDLLCHVHEVIDEVRGFIGTLGQAANVLPLIGVATAGTAVTPVVLGMAKVVSDLGLVADVLNELQKLLPRVQDTLEVTASPRRLKDNENGTVRVYAQLLTDADICRDTIGRLIGEIAKNLAKRVIRRVPLPNLAYFIRQRSSSLGDNQPDLQAQLEGFLRDAIQNITNEVLSATGLNQLLERSRSKICSVKDRNRVALEPREELLRVSPGNAGFFLNQQEETIEFFCDANAKGRVRITATRECGVEGSRRRQLRGQVDITCNTESCREDAVRWLEASFVFQPPAPRPSSCLSVKEELDFNVVHVFFKNTHESRSIAMASVVLFESDKQTLPKSHCGELRLDLCINQTVGSCNAPPGIFVEPMKTTTVPWVFECRREALFPTSGTCGEREIETITGSILLQAVFCDDFNTAQKEFCSLADPLQIGAGEPTPVLPYKVIRPVCQ